MRLRRAARRGGYSVLTTLSLHRTMRTSGGGGDRHPLSNSVTPQDDPHSNPASLFRKFPMSRTPPKSGIGAVPVSGGGPMGDRTHSDHPRVRAYAGIGSRPNSSPSG